MNIIIAGGGTGGHLFPGIAIAEAFKEKDPNNNILFVSTGRPVELAILKKSGYSHRRITAEGIKGRGTWNQIISLLKIPKGIIDSFLILKEFQCDLVVGVGSYSSGPVVIAAWLTGIRIALHEQNILPGITNRVLSCFADRIYVSFKNTTGLNQKKLIVTGNPVRKEIRKLSSLSPATEHENEEKSFTVLISGGSQGAHSINIMMTEALKHISGKERFFFIHQTGNQDIEAVKSAYTEHGISCVVKPFFDDMARQYQQTDLIICRAGATTAAEITAIGKPAIFIPFPFAADNHQVLNARTLAQEGAAEMILQHELTGEILARRIEYYASNPDSLKIMKEQAEKFGRPDAAEVIVKDCYNICQQG